MGAASTSSRFDLVIKVTEVDKGAAVPVPKCRVAWKKRAREERLGLRAMRTQEGQTASRGRGMEITQARKQLQDLHKIAAYLPEHRLIMLIAVHFA